jgi:hypothetical protein
MIKPMMIQLEIRVRSIDGHGNEKVEKRETRRL